jgi:hypothetical protein
MMAERIDIEMKVVKLYSRDSLRASDELQAFTLRQLNSAIDLVNTVSSK